jgi:hypothetical protein
MKTEDEFIFNEWKNDIKENIPIFYPYECKFNPDEKPETDDNLTDTIPDDVKIHKHGFDKTSFRKQSTKKG